MGSRTAWFVLTAAMAVSAGAQEALDWESSQFFEYRLGSPSLTVDAAGQRVVSVAFAVVNPKNGNQPWDILNAPEFKQPAGASRLSVNFGWSTTDYQNTGSAGEGLLPVPFRTVGGVASGGGAGVGAALPILVDALRRSTPVGPSAPGWYTVSAVLPTQA
ncbi:MAG: hypothetical protein JNL97_01920, partial [Verrucomicrobiales bacterium]|nr:hypothetical protein [Verrucomicrobiales bacterium]